MTSGRPPSGLTAPWLARTKLQPPAPPGGLIHRPHLVDAISAGLRRARLVLLSAPAGYGKTSLLATLSAALADATVAWLTLDEDDDDWARFLAGLVAAVHHVEPRWGAAAAAQLAALVRPIETRDPLALGRRVISALINDLLESEPRRLVLILDDLHRVHEPAVYAMLDYLLDFLPATMRLVVATRRDPPLPLARLRSQDQLMELRPPELRFSQAEVVSLLTEQLHLDLSREDLALLQTRLEGWPAGLRIVAATLQRLPSAVERRALINRLPTSGHLFDYLAEEILDRQTAAVRAFLLETSILAELTPHLCQAVTGRPDAQAILRDLKGRNLVAEINGESGPAFRYHDLLSTFLRQRLAQEQPERLAELHGRAAAAEPSPGRAIDHYLAAGRWEEAARATERVGRQLLHQGLLDTLQAKIRALPAAVREAHPRLLSLLGASAWQQGDIEGAEALLRQALGRFEATGDEAGQGEALAELASCAFLMGDFGRLLEIVERALPLPLLPQSRIQLLMGRSLLAYLAGDWTSAAADFEAATKIARRSDDVDVFLTLASQLLPGCALLPGNFRRFERVCRQARAYLGETPTPLHVVVETQLTFLHMLRAEPEKTLRHGQRVLDMAERLRYLTTNASDTAAALAVVCTALGDFAAADRYFETLFRYVELLPAEQKILAVRLYQMGKARWSEGRLQEAREIEARMRAAKHPRELSLCPPARAMMRGLLALSDGQYALAERSLRRAEALCLRLPAAAFFLGNPRLLLALLYLEVGRPDAALAELAPVMADAEQRGTPGLLFIEGPRVTPLLRLAAERGVHAHLARRVLAHFYAAPSRRQARVLSTGEVLTARELEILGLLVAGLGNRAIAERLVITENTTKAHLYRIFRKLNVSSRAQAAARACELGLA